MPSSQHWRIDCDDWLRQMGSTRFGRAWFFACSLAVAGCGGSERITVNCPGALIPSLVVTARDLATSQPLTGIVTVTATLRGSPAITAKNSEGFPVVVNGNPGTYDVIVHADGYLDWAWSNVVVESDGCHPIPVKLEAWLHAKP